METETTQVEVKETKQPEEKKKKFNAPLFIVLTLMCVAPGLLYLIAYILTPKDGVHRGNVGKTFCAIIVLATALILDEMVTFGDVITLAGVILLIIAVVGLIFKKKIFSVIYLVCVLAFYASLIYFLIVYPSYIIFLCFTPMMIGCVMGIVASIRGIKNVNNKPKQ